MADKQQTTPITLTAAYWPREDERVEAGETIEVTIETALKLIEEGKARRADPLGR